MSAALRIDRLAFGFGLLLWSALALGCATSRETLDVRPLEVANPAGFSRAAPPA